MRLRKWPKLFPQIHLSTSHSSGIIHGSPRLLCFKICNGDADTCESDLTCCASHAPFDRDLSSLPYRLRR